MNNYPYKITEAADKSESLTNYLHSVKSAKKSFENLITPIFDQFFQQTDQYITSVENHELDINYENPMIHISKRLLSLYMLLIECANQFWLPQFNATPKKVIVLPRCLTGPNFDLLKVKRTRIGWHKVIGTQNMQEDAWLLSQDGTKYGFEVFITMGSRFKEPNFLIVFRNLRKKFGHFGLIAVACIPELALGNTYIMEMGIPSHAVPLLYSGCAKWHGSSAIQTRFPYAYIRNLLGIDRE